MQYEVKIVIDIDAPPDIALIWSSLMATGYKVKGISWDETPQAATVAYQEVQEPPRKAVRKRGKKPVLDVELLGGRPRFVMDYVATQDDREFTFDELSELKPEISYSSLRAIIHKLVKRGFLQRIDTNIWRKGPNAK